jgi:hypothetical protein
VCDASSYEAICFAMRRGDVPKARRLTSRRSSGRGELRAEQVIRVPAMDAVDLHAVQVFSNAIQIHVFDMALQP